MKRFSFVIVLALSQNALAADFGWEHRIRDVEDSSLGIYAKSEAIVDSVISSNVKLAGKTIKYAEFSAIEKQHSDLTAALENDGQMVQSNAAALFKDGIYSELGFATPQQGEKASKADRLRAAIQRIECAKVSARIATEYLGKSGAILGRDILTRCKKLVDEKLKAN